MIRYIVSWYDKDTDLTISKRVELDDSALEDIALETVPKGYLRDMLNSNDPIIDVEDY